MNKYAEQRHWLNKQWKDAREAGVNGNSRRAAEKNT
jgi:hypothetical protein